MSSDEVQEFSLSGDEPHGPPRKGDTRSPRRHVWRGPWPWAAIAVVLVLVGAATVPPREASIQAWGVVEDLTTTPVQDWSITDGGPIRSALLTDVALVLVRNTAVVGVDTATGEQLWSNEWDHGVCTTDGESVVCTDAGDRAVQWAGDTGATLGQIEVEAALVAARADGDWYVVSAADPEQHRLIRYSAGEKVWSVEVANQLPTTPFGNTLTVVAGRVLLTATGAGAPSGAVVDAATGDVVADSDGPTGVSIVAQTAQGVWSRITFDSGTRYIRGQAAPVRTSSIAAQMAYDGQWDSEFEPRRFRRPKRQSESEGYGVINTATGQWAWRDSEAGWPIARLDGAILAVQSTRAGPPNLVGRDVTSGEELWQKQGAWLSCPCVADSTTLAIFRNELRTEPSGAVTVQGRRLVGLQARTGDSLWHLDAPRSTFALLTDGEELIAVSSTEVRAWKLA